MHEHSNPIELIGISQTVSGFWEFALEFFDGFGLSRRHNGKQKQSACYKDMQASSEVHYVDLGTAKIIIKLNCGRNANILSTVTLNHYADVN